MKADNQNNIKAMQGPDQKSFTALYQAYSSALFRAINRMLKNDALSEDALQNTFIKIWLHLDRYDAEKACLFTWMLNIARNEAIDVLRSKHGKCARVTISLNGHEHVLAKNLFFVWIILTCINNFSFSNHGTGRFWSYASSEALPARKFPNCCRCRAARWKPECSTATENWKRPLYDCFAALLFFWWMNKISLAYRNWFFTCIRCVIAG